MINIILNIVSVIFALLAAIFWFKSARIKNTRDYHLTPEGNLRSIEPLLESLQTQNSFNARAAFFACMAALAQTIILLLGICQKIIN